MMHLSGSRLVLSKIIIINVFPVRICHIMFEKWHKEMFKSRNFECSAPPIHFRKTPKWTTRSPEWRSRICLRTQRPSRGYPAQLIVSISWTIRKYCDSCLVYFYGRNNPLLCFKMLLHTLSSRLSMSTSSKICERRGMAQAAGRTEKICGPTERRPRTTRRKKKNEGPLSPSPHFARSSLPYLRIRTDPK